MKIQRKLILAFIFPIVLIGSFGLIGFIWNKSLFVEATQVNAVKAQDALEIKLLDNEASRYMLAYFVLGDANYRTFYNQAVAEQKQYFTRYEKLPITETEKNAVSKMENEVDESTVVEKSLFDLDDQRFELYKENKNLLEENIFPLFLTWHKELKANPSESHQKENLLYQIEMNIDRLASDSNGRLLFWGRTTKDSAQIDMKEIMSLLSQLSTQNLSQHELMWMQQLQDYTNKMMGNFSKLFQFTDKRYHYVHEDEQITMYADDDLNQKLHAQAESETQKIYNTILAMNYAMMIIIAGLVVLGGVLSWIFSDYLIRPIRYLKNSIDQLRAGKEVAIHRISDDEVGDLAENFGDLVKENKSHLSTMSEQSWLKEHITEVLKSAQAEPDLERMCTVVITKIANLLNVGCAAFYITKESDKKEKILYLMGTYGYKKRKNISNKFKFGESLVGQCALEGKSIVITSVPEDYIHITSGLGDKHPNAIVVLPVVLENKIMGVIELASFQDITSIQHQLLEQLSNSLGVVIEAIQNRREAETALQRVQETSDALQTQQEELRTTNEELEEKTHHLQQSEEELKTQSEELKTTNEELEEKMHAITEQNHEIEVKNKELEQARRELEARAKALTKVGKYKTEFLSNMSHELRTPLNSLLLLSKSFVNNDDGNLTPEQIEQANIIYKGGKDLLALINDILDLSKVEAGKLNIQVESAKIADIVDDLKRQFESVTQAQGLQFIMAPANNVTEIKTDAHRLKQILRNLISNAIKFTKTGYIKLEITKPEKNIKLNSKEFLAGNYISFSVIDTGIGIEKGKHQDIFEAFQQAYGNTDRIYGGTGLGLTISRELAKLLGGEITLESVVGQGSTFTVFMPTEISAEKTATLPILAPHAEGVPPAGDIKNEKRILIIGVVQPLLNSIEKIAKNKGYDYTAVPSLQEGLRMVEKQSPSGIILMDNDAAPHEISKALNEYSKRKNIPMHIISSQESLVLRDSLKESDLEKIFEHFIVNPKKLTARILLIEDNTVVQKEIAKTVKGKNIDIVIAATGEEGIKQLTSDSFDGLVLDLKLPDMDGGTLLKEMSNKQKTLPPVIIYSEKDLSPEEILFFNQFTNKIIRKEGPPSLDRLLSECTLFLHSVNQKTNIKSETKMLVEPDKLLLGKKVLLVDDDMRNVYALSKVLQRQGMQVAIATNGEEAIKKIDHEHAIDIIVTDIMMPVMDGYEMIKRIRKKQEWSELPIIAVTAKAMPDDKKSCMDAGANDYITKPIDEEKLLSAMKIWLSASPPR